MPSLPGKISPSIFNFQGSVSPDEVKELLLDPDVEIVQTSSPADTATWDLLNQEFFAVRPDIKLRVYGFYFQVCDLAFLSQVRNVRRLSADCLRSATRLEHLTDLPHLESLNIGIYDLDSFELLADLPCEQIHTLSLEMTGSKCPNLHHLDRFKNLKTLYIEGHTKEIERIGSLKYLEDLTLRSVTVPDLSFLQKLHNLWSLDIKLGGSKDLSGLAGMSQLKYLELWQIKGLSDISVVSTLTGLQYLFLQSLSNVMRLPDLSQLSHLRRIFCDHLSPGLDLSTLASASALQEFFFATKGGLAPDAYEWIAKLKSIRRATIALGSYKRNCRVQELFDAHGVAAYESKQFVYV